MTTQTEALSVVDTLKLALEALEHIDLWLKTRYSGIGLVGVELDAIIAIKEALSELEQDDEVLGFNGWGFPIEKPSQPEQRSNEHLDSVAWIQTHECKSVSGEYKDALYDLHTKAVLVNLDIAYCMEWMRRMAEKLDTIVSHTETWTGVDGYPMHVLTSVEMVPQLRYFLEKGIHDTFISHMKQCLDATPPQRKPLTKEQRIQIVKDNTIQGYHGDYFDAWGIIDDVEAAHGITKEDV